MRYLLLILALVGTQFLSGQAVDTVRFGSVQEVFGDQARPYLDLEYSLGLESGQWSTKALSDFFRGGFLDERKKAALLEPVDQTLSLGAQQSVLLRFVYQGHKQAKLVPIPKRSLYLINRNYQALSLGKGLLDLALYGNKKFAGQELSSQEIQYQSWYYTGLGFQFGFLLDTIPLSIGVALHGIHDHQSLSSQVGSLFTASNGAYIDFQGNYDFYGLKSQSLLALQGLGLAMDLETTETFQGHRLSFSLQDFGLAYFARIERLYRDTNFRFNGFDLGRLLRNQDPLIEAQGDSIDAALRANETVSLWRLMPFRVNLDYRWQWQRSQASALGLNLDYLYLPAYRLRTELSYRYQKEDWSGQIGLSYGGFTTWSVNVAFNWDFSKYWHLRLQLDNLSGLILQERFNGAVAGIALHYDL